MNKTILLSCLLSIPAWSAAAVVPAAGPVAQQLKALGSPDAPAVPPVPPTVPVVVPAPVAPTPKVYTASSKWTRDSGNGFDALRQLGVQGDAENRAIAQCQAAGGLNCVITGSALGSSSDYACTATASAVDMVLVPGAQYQTVTKTRRWTKNGGYGFESLEQIGVQKSARDDARNSCQAAGLLDCVVVSSAIDHCGDYECSATGVARGRR